MSNQSSLTVVLANSPRLFRELLQHALKTAPALAHASFKVVEAKDVMPAASVLEEADWLVVDEEAVQAAQQAAAAHPHLRVLSLEGRGHRVQRLESLSPARWTSVAETPSLEQLLDLLSQSAAEEQPQAAWQS